MINHPDLFAKAKYYAYPTRRDGGRSIHSFDNDDKSIVVEWACNLLKAYPGAFVRVRICERTVKGNIKIGEVS